MQRLVFLIILLIVVIGFAFFLNNKPEEISFLSYFTKDGGKQIAQFIIAASVVLGSSIETFIRLGKRIKPLTDLDNKALNDAEENVDEEQQKLQEQLAQYRTSLENAKEDLEKKSIEIATQQSRLRALTVITTAGAVLVFIWIFAVNKERLAQAAQITPSGKRLNEKVVDEHFDSDNISGLQNSIASHFVTDFPVINYSEKEIIIGKEKLRYLESVKIDDDDLEEIKDTYNTYSKNFGTDESTVIVLECHNDTKGTEALNLYSSLMRGLYLQNAIKKSIGQDNVIILIKAYGETTRKTDKYILVRFGKIKNNSNKSLELGISISEE